MPGPSVSITLFEPVAYLRGQSASGEARGRRHTSAINHDSQPSQLRGLVTVHLPKPTRIKTVELTLSGVGRTDWPEGIGNNRVELAEACEIFKQQVTLFDARTQQAPAAQPLRRAHSVGPGIGFDDDATRTATEPTTPSAGTGSKGKERETAAALAKSVGKVAAKAGTVMLPPTILRDLTHSRVPKDKDRDKEAANHKGQQQQLPGNRRRSTVNAADLGSLPMPRPLSPTVARFDPPPMYERIHTPPALEAHPGHSSSSASSSPGSYFHERQAPAVSSNITAPGHLPPPADKVTLPAQSCSAAGPHGRSILHPPRSREASPAVNGQVAMTEAATTDSTSTGRGPALLSPTARHRADRVAQAVRFDPRDVVEAGNDVAASDAAGRMTGISHHGAVTQHEHQRQSGHSASAPCSRRTSLDLLNHVSDGANSHKSGAADGGSKSKGKAKAHATLTGSDSSATGSKSPPLGLRKPSGLKQLLGGLRKEEQTKSGTAASSSSKKLPSFPQSPTSSSAGLSSTASAAPRRSVEGALAKAHQPPAFHTPPPDSREFKKGTYTYSISLPLPANLPPTLYADFGRNTYTLKALVKRSGPLTPNLSCEREVVMVHAPDEEGTEETEAIIVERSWEEALTYRVFISGRSFACGSKIPLWMKFIPLGEKVRLWRFTAVLEEKTHYYAKARKVARHETPRRWNLLKLVGEEGKPLLPIISDNPDAMRRSPLAQHAMAAAGFRLPEGTRAGSGSHVPSGATRPSSSRPNAAAGPGDVTDPEDGEDEEAAQDALASLMDPTGPWELSMDLQLPGLGSKINLSTDHAKSSITVHHLLRLTFRVEKASSGVYDASTGLTKPKLFDIVIECPISLNHSRTSDIWLSLPNYWSVAGSSSPIPPTSSSAAAIEDEADSYFLPRRPHTPGASPRGGVSPGGTHARGMPWHNSLPSTPSDSRHWLRPEHQSSPSARGSAQMVSSPPPPPPPSEIRTPAVQKESESGAKSEGGDANDVRELASQWIQLSLESAEAGRGPSAHNIASPTVATTGGEAVDHAVTSSSGAGGNSDDSTRDGLAGSAARDAPGSPQNGVLWASGSLAGSAQRGRPGASNESASDLPPPYSQSSA